MLRHLFLKLTVWLFMPLTMFALDASKEYRIVFIHLGRSLPDHTYVALEQARLFNPDSEVILIANQEALDSSPFSLKNVTTIAAESIKKTKEHELFRKRSNLDKSFREGFWFYTTERLFYLDDLIVEHDLKNTFHLENDNLLYVNLHDLLPIFVANYKGLAIPFEQDDRGAASCIFVASQKSSHALARYLRENCRSDKSEMYLISYFKTKFGREYADHLPNITKEYAEDHNPLINLSGRADLLDPMEYARHVDQFQSLFDACSYGQYLGGIDPRNGPDGPGYLNPVCVFICSYMDFQWEMDEQGRKIPYMVYRNKKNRINNLHIHSKDLRRFASIEFN